MKTFSRDILITIVLAAVIFFGLQATVQKFAVDGPSMQPRLQHGQQLLVNKVVYKLFHEPERGDIVIFDSPENRQGDFIKRIIGLPGESVEIRKGIVYIHTKDGSVVPLDEPYVENPAMIDFHGDKIPENEYFVLGDNRNNSDDSRQGWTVPRQDIIGKAWLSIWPPGQWGLAANHPLQAQIDNTAN
jgi:signal peptidase I